MQAVEANYCLGARYYDSKLGRWLTPDPLADKYPGWSTYNYCLNNPLNYVDPDGNDPGLAAAALAAGAALGVGITLYATYEVTKNYLEHPSSVNIPNRSTVMGVALGYANSVYNTVSNWFNSRSENTNDNTEHNTNTETGAKSSEEHQTHIEKHEAAKQKLKELEETLSKTKGPKKQAPIKKQIEELKKDIKGHEKEIRQKWGKAED